MISKLDKSSFEELFRTYFAPLCSFAEKYVGDADDAKDIIHQVFIGLWHIGLCFGLAHMPRGIRSSNFGQTNMVSGRPKHKQDRGRPKQEVFFHRQILV